MIRVNEIVQNCKNALQNYYGSRFEGLVLYGSMARNQASLVSDIDLIVLLNEQFDYFYELQQIVNILYPIQLESEHLISAKPAAITEYEQGRIQLYRYVKSEGIVI